METRARSSVESLVGKMRPLDVLLIEDNPADARLTQEMLFEAGPELFKLTIAQSLREAATHSAVCEIILLDLSLPDADGLDTFELAQALGEVPIIVVSGHSDELMALRAMVAGAQDYLVKGQFTAEMLSRSIRYAMERHRLDGQRQQAVAALKESEERYRRFFEDDLSGDCVLAADGSIIACNPAFVDMFGFESIEDARRVNLTELLASPEALDEMVGKLAREGKIERFEMTFRHRTGRLMEVVGNAAGTLDDSSTLVEYRIFLIDETERKQTQEQLREAQKMEAIGRLAGGVAHDFNNLLTAVSFQAEFLLSRLPEGDLLRKRAQDIKSAAQRAASLTGQLLTFSRNQVRQAKLVDLNQIIRGVIDLFDRLIGEDILVSEHLQEDLWMVKADPSQLEQVILNLVVNARDAMPGGGRLTLKTANRKGSEPPAGARIASGDCVGLSVRDTGEGMSPEIQSKIFEPFFTTKRQGHGTGLGLSTVYGIIQQSNGRITVDSALGHGTLFEVLLPRAGAAEQESPLSEPSGVIQLGSEKILVVEDDDSIRELIIESLQNQGFEVMGASTGAEALRKAELYLESLDLLITDVVMPGLAGPDLAARLRAKRRDLQIVYMSGYVDDPRVRGAIEATGNTVLSKPFSPAKLTTLVREILDDGRELSVLRRGKG